MEALNLAWTQISPVILGFLYALFLLLIGYLIARGLSLSVTYLLKLLQLDKASKRIGFHSLLEKGDIRRTAAELSGDLVYWVILFLAIIGVTKVFGLPVEIAFKNVLSYLVLVLMAALVLGMGLFFASLIAGMVKIIAANFGIEGSKTLSRVIYYIIIVFAFLAALAQLGINPEVLAPQIGVIVGAIGLAAAIAFGLGCKDMAADFLHNLFKGR